MKSGKREHNSSKKQRQKKTKITNDEDEVGSSDKTPGVANHPKYNRFNKPRPTHFLSLRIDSPTIVNGVKKLQDDIILRNPQLQPYLTPAIKSHLTLFILNLPNPESIEKAKQTLASCREILTQHYSTQPCTVNIGGLGTFNNRVIFVGLEESEHKKKLQEFVYSMYAPFKEAGLTCEELEKPWTPHCTIMKLSKQNNKRSGQRGSKNSKDNNEEANDGDEVVEVAIETTTNSKNNNSAKSTFVKVHKIDKEAYAQHMGIQFGEQIFAGVELSSMGAIDPDGYYQCLHKELFYIPPTTSTLSTTSSSSSTQSSMQSSIV